MTAKLDKIHEMYKLLNEKERVNHDIMSRDHGVGSSDHF